MEDNKKLEFTYCGDIKIEFANIRVIEIGSSLKFTLDERFPWINVYLGDKRIVHKKKKKTALGEMEQIVLKKSDLTQGLKFDKIIMKLEEV